MTNRLEMPTEQEQRRRALSHTIAHIMGEFARCEDPAEYENIENATAQVLAVFDRYDNHVSVSLQVAEATLRNLARTMIVSQPGPFRPQPFAPQYKDVIEAMARAVYDAELCLGERASSVLIDMMVGKPGSKATPESIRANMRVETYEENPEAWRRYAVAALVAYMHHSADEKARSASAVAPEENVEVKPHD